MKAIVSSCLLANDFLMYCTQDDILKKLQSKVEEEQRVWETEQRTASEASSRLSAERDTLVSQKRELESTIKDLQGLSQTVVEMEEKLKDLQSKLQGEEHEKKALVTKFDEVSIEV